MLFDLLVGEMELLICDVFIVGCEIQILIVVLKYFYCIERSMSLGAKNIWNYIMNLEKTGRDFIGMRATLKSLLKIMQIMNLLKMMTKTSPHTGLPPTFFFFPSSASCFDVKNNIFRCVF